MLTILVVVEDIHKDDNRRMRNAMFVAWNATFVMCFSIMFSNLGAPTVLETLEYACFRDKDYRGTRTFREQIPSGPDKDPKPSAKDAIQISHVVIPMGLMHVLAAWKKSTYVAREGFNFRGPTRSEHRRLR